MSERDDTSHRYRPMATADYRPMQAQIRAGNVPDYALAALRQLDPDFAAWLDQQNNPPPAAPAAPLPVPEQSEVA